MIFFPMFLGIFDNAVVNLMNGIRDILQGWVLSNLQDMLTSINESTSTISGELMKSPQQWNTTIYDLITEIASKVALPVAGTVFVFVITWELITMLTSPKMGDVDIVDVIIRWLLKAMVAAWFIANSLTLCNTFFGLGGYMVSETKTILDGQLASVTNDKSETIIKFFKENFGDQTEDATSEEVGNLLGLGISTVILNLVMKVLGLLINIVMYSRMITIYLYCSVAPIPASTLTNGTLNHIGIGYFKSVLALAFQAVLMMICVAIYGALLTTLFDPYAGTVADSIGALNKAVWECVGLSLLLVFTLTKTGNVTKQIFGIQ